MPPLPVYFPSWQGPQWSWPSTGIEPALQLVQEMDLRRRAFPMQVEHEVPLLLYCPALQPEQPSEPAAGWKPTSQVKQDSDRRRRASPWHTVQSAVLPVLLYSPEEHAAAQTSARQSWRTRYSNPRIGSDCILELEVGIGKTG